MRAKSWRKDVCLVNLYLHITSIVCLPLLQPRFGFFLGTQHQMYREPTWCGDNWKRSLAPYQKKKKKKKKISRDGVCYISQFAVRNILDHNFEPRKMSDNENGSKETDRKEEVRRVCNGDGIMGSGRNRIIWEGVLSRVPRYMVAYSHRHTVNPTTEPWRPFTDRSVTVRRTRNHELCFIRARQRESIIPQWLTVWFPKAWLVPFFIASNIVQKMWI